MPAEITIPAVGVIILIVMVVACASLAVISYCALRVLIGLVVGNELYVADHSGECDVPTCALRGRTITRIPPEFR
jgi:hypothetical protein